MKYDFPSQANTDVKKLVGAAAFTLDEIKAYIDQYMDNFDVNRVNPNNIDIIGNLIGYPFSNETEPEFKRKLLQTAIDFYKAKGTEDSIRILFYTLGLNVDVVPLWTADYVDIVEISSPYMRVTFNLSEKTNNYADVTVINPDEQLDTLEAGIIL